MVIIYKKFKNKIKETQNKGSPKKKQQKKTAMKTFFVRKRA